MFDDSIEEIYIQKEFVKLATTGRHNDLDNVFVKKKTIYSNKADGHELMIWTYRISIYSNQLVLFSNLITSEDTLMLLNFYDNRMSWLQGTSLVIY